MSKLCEAFNRINSKFGANRVKLHDIDTDPDYPYEEIFFELVGFGHFRMKGDRLTVECSEGDYSRSACSQWLEAIANGKIRDEAGNMVDPK